MPDEDRAAGRTANILAPQRVMENSNDEGFSVRRLSLLLFINRLLRNVLCRVWMACFFHIILATVNFFVIAITDTFDTGRFGKLYFYSTTPNSEKV
ncbi:MAG: hypothetical protein ABSA26_00600 [Thermoguttaceae bacterium]